MAQAPSPRSTASTAARSLHGKVLFITGASRGIGEAIALRAARDGAKIAVIGKTDEPHPKLKGTVHATCAAVALAGGEALACVADIRDDAAVEAAVKATVDRFGGIDILVNNASAISLTGTLDTPAKRFDLMHQVNIRGTFLCSQLAIPHLRRAANPHVLNIAPPLNWETRWFAPHVAYTMAKYGMSLCVLAMAEEFAKDGIAFNALWPRTTIATAAVRNLLGGEDIVKRSRTPESMADAAYAIVTRPSRETSGNFFLAEDVLRAAGVTDLRSYQVDPELPEKDLAPDFFV
jgi:citronellol/citronellal dehydrogenase